jgi:medium-chain acyl-[acyl-carrier-protein] hydrolase
MHRSSLTRVSAIVEPLTQAIAGWPDKPFAFFGHSMGALLAFEVARKLRRERLRGPLGLFISARRAPQLEAEPMTYNLPEAEFMDELRRLNGTPREVLENAEMLQLMLPILRADFEVCQTYEYNYEPPLDCPIRAFGGTQDADVPAEHLEAWREQTTASFLLRMLHGDHFFIHTSQPLLLKMVASDLDRLMRDEK